MKKNKTILLIFTLLIIVLLQSCCSDCPVNPTNPSFLCRVREASITQFNPNLIEQRIPRPGQPDSIFYIPVPEYSIHSYAFPSDLKSSGSLPNDNRFIENSFIPVVTIPFSDGSPYLAAIIDNRPLNNNMEGDILVDSVFITGNILNNIAYIQVRGYIAKMTTPFLSESSTEFCNYIEQNSDEINRKKDSLSLYGWNIGITKQFSLSNAQFVAIDKNGKIDYNVSVSVVDRLSLLEKVANQSIIIPVRVGDVFYYTAINGRSFAFVVVNISQGSLPPNKKFIKIMFNPL